MGQVISFFFLGISARSVSARCGYILAWYPGPVTLSGSWRLFFQSVSNDDLEGDDYILLAYLSIEE